MDREYFCPDWTGIMSTHLDSHKFLALLSPFKNASIINSKGELIYSKDADSFKTTTSRIVLFQIAKKYLSPKPGDIIVSNDPENGGTQLNRIFFICSLHTNLFIVWDAELNEVQFKIPLTPLVEANKKNQMIWQVLIESQPAAEKFKTFFEKQISKMNQVQVFKKFILSVASDSFQKTWFNLTKSIFEDHFSLKSYGQHQLSIKYRGQQIKINVDADEKQNIKSFKLDFSGTEMANHFACASHVVESGLMIEISKYYHFERCLSQPILDHLKLLLPPQSIVSKSIPNGEYNFELQKLTRQMMKHCLNQMNIQGKKSEKKFLVYSTAYLSLNSEQIQLSNFLSNSRIDFLVSDLFDKKVLTHTDRDYKATLTYRLDKPSHLNIYGVKSITDTDTRWIKLNGEIVHHGQFTLKKNDELSFCWKI
jgi:hypothetical protein